jgi:glycerophosphoryl diester phosphodiesterase
MRRWSRLEGHNWRWLIDRPIAHRGFHDIAAGVPENTLAAFAAAIARGLAIECDVRLAGDGGAIVFHDDNTLRLTGVDLPVATALPGELSALRIAGTEERIPTLEDALRFAAGNTPILIEMKSPPEVGPLEAAIAKALAGYRGPAAVMSFSPASVRWFADNAPGVLRGLTSGPYRRADGLNGWRRFVRRHLLVAAKSRPHFVAHNVDCLDLAASRLWRRFGGPLLTWTVKSSADYARLRSKADGLIFEGFDPPD